MQSSFSQKYSVLKCCVLIPTYNNCKTLQKVIEETLLFTENILVINDGSTDDTAAILNLFPQLKQIQLPVNKGKGYALRQGFKLAETLGFEYAITLDSDGQHFPEDIPVFLEALQNSENKKLLLIGARNMGQENVPKKSSFGNTFSNFWFWVETGNWLQDTQSGFRLYPLFAMHHLKFYTKKFEFEIEAIVKAAWSGIEVKNIPIQIHYDTVARVSHFRPFQDFTRISILNTYFVLLTFFYIKPRDLFRKLRSKGVKRFFLEDFLGSEDSAKKKALSIGLGVLIGLSPVWGFHTILVFFLAIFLKLNKMIAFAFSNISLPPFIPFVFLISLQLGNWILGEGTIFSLENISQNFDLIKHVKTYILGSIALAISASVLFGSIGYIFFSIFERKKLQRDG